MQRDCHLLTHLIKLKVLKFLLTRLCLLVSFLLIIKIGNAQNTSELWGETTAVPILDNDRLLCLAASGQSLYAGTTNGIYVSSDEGTSWQPLNSPLVPIYQLKINKGIMCGLSVDNRLVVSIDGGENWKSKIVVGAEAITDILILDDGVIYAGTGNVITVNGVARFEGNGLYRSTDYGDSWSLVKTGVSDSQYISHVIKDSKGHLIVGYNELSALDGRIVYSEDAGETWQNIPDILFDWGGSKATSNIARITHLSFDQHDNLFLSFQGALERAATSVNLRSSYELAKAGVEWNHVNIVGYGYPWFYMESYNMFTSKCGDTYSSLLGMSFNLSGIFYKPHGNEEFNRESIEPIYFDDGSFYFNYVSFAELSNGKVFAIQQLDKYVYYSNAMTCMPVGLPETPPDLQFEIFPNPVTDYFTIHYDGLEMADLSIISIGGERKVVTKINNEDIIYTSDFELNQGAYLLVLQIGSKRYFHKLLIAR